MFQQGPPTGSPFVFLPPAGGDLTLQSYEGTTFRAHSVLLGLASTVFAGMLTAAITSDTVELAEDREAVSLMLAFIYPIDLPSINTVDQLEKIMLLSQRYDIERMIKFVGKCNNQDNQLVLSDPIRVFRASVKHDSPAIRALSTKAFGMKHLDPYTIEGLQELARKFPESSSIIGLIGTQLVRSKLLAELLKGSPTNVALRPVGNHGNIMACRQCWDKSRCNWDSTGYRYTPGWMPFWLAGLHDRLVEQPMDSCEDPPRIACVVDFYASKSGDCSSCITQTLTKRSLFEQWGRDTKQFIDKELEVLDKLCAL